ncbi:MAG TPA: aspartyl beta-hydroxylase [Cryomorphaceae bacterium]|nr:aspartyl beta-hydroxylase [Owenweeksia sp.]MBF99239.1 aspartyl beta-hydroxylase [Owenweeksia sp.]HAD97932.1 aspartyl beta-hydroxylase [Cryomorphaceae bacterium]HBF20239.1 aspartyl beta-hydroxylase [Cryomorphaceae bacterium]HCQ16456.1 aspartyl beta-hydroxylase [Cryomorphaceae bacterium]|tara:strand:+ start:1416 stop:1970 length:555 start_codon:yes stop_codon:yes gene_type:complete
MKIKKLVVSAFDLDQLKGEVQSLPQQAWIPHFNTQYYTGHWSVVPLRSVGGQSEHIYPNPASDKPFEDTRHLKVLPVTQQVINSIPGEKTSVRFMKLGAESSIREHEDYNLSLEDEDLRIHVPVFTHEEAEFWLDGERVPMMEGECWYLNFNLRHRLYNPGPGDRIHLVMDCVVSDELREFIQA